MSKKNPQPFAGKVTLWKEDGKVCVGLSGSHLRKGVRVTTLATGGAGIELLHELRMQSLAEHVERLHAVLDIEVTFDFAVPHGDATAETATFSWGFGELHAHWTDGELRMSLAGEQLPVEDDYELARAVADVIADLGWRIDSCYSAPSRLMVLIQLLVRDPRISSEGTYLTVHGKRLVIQTCALATGRDVHFGEHGQAIVRPASERKTTVMVLGSDDAELLWWLRTKGQELVPALEGCIPIVLLDRDIPRDQFTASGAYVVRPDGMSLWVSYLGTDYVFDAGARTGDGTTTTGFGAPASAEMHEQMQILYSLLVEQGVAQVVRPRTSDPVAVIEAQDKRSLAMQVLRQAGIADPSELVASLTRAGLIA